MADRDNNRVQVFTTAGVFVSSIDCGYGSNPYDVAVDNMGSIHVTLHSSSCVAIYSTFDDKRPITYKASNNLQSPTGIAVDEEGYRYVACNVNSCICMFSPKGEFISSSSCFSAPCCMALDTRSGNIYVSSGTDKCIGKY